MMKTLNQLSSSIVLSAILVLSPNSPKGQNALLNRPQAPSEKPLNNQFVNTARFIETSLNLTLEQDSRISTTIATSRQLMRTLRRQKNALFRQLQALDSSSEQYEHQWQHLNRQHDVVLRDLLSERSKISDLVRDTLTVPQKRRLVAMYEHLKVVFPEAQAPV